MPIVVTSSAFKIYGAVETFFLAEDFILSCFPVECGDNPLLALSVLLNVPFWGEIHDPKYLLESCARTVTAQLREHLAAQG
ncbi:hypothetical protein GBAR_LOCUS12621 [Geodia barretti]|uniref:Uncharacterized protein n=1 Tax=Geodia barretti TaxID=519541 RepID=A0AA35S2Z1_GEOBA|nr:hypothetical protein GBAR_LOCUS12621 [Geodia barretti]